MKGKKTNIIPFSSVRKYMMNLGADIVERNAVVYLNQFLEEKARYNDQLILVTHGFFNRVLAKEMKKRGWKRIQNEGQKIWVQPFSGNNRIDNLTFKCM